MVQGVPSEVLIPENLNHVYRMDVQEWMNRLYAVWNNKEKQYGVGITNE